MAAGILSELGTSRAAESQRTGRPARTVGGVPHDRILSLGVSIASPNDAVRRYWAASPRLDR